MSAAPRFTTIAIALIAVVTMGGCAAVGVEVVESYDRDKLGQFRKGLAVQNAARIRQGLLPLDLCSQSYWKDRRWAMKVGGCMARLHGWEFGDSTALDPPDMVLPTTVSVVPDSVQRIYDERARTDEFLYGRKK